MKTKAVIFDKDGTLMDFECFWVTVSRYAIANILKKCGINNVSADEILPCLDVKNGIANINGILAQSPYTVMGAAIHKDLQKYGCNFSIEEITQMTIDSYHANIDKGIVSAGCDNITEVISKLKMMGLKLAVITTDDPFDTKMCLEKLGIIDYFDEIYTDDGVLPPKPNPYCINLFCEKYSLKKDEVIMVGDTLNDVRFAENGGVGFVGVAKCETNKDVLTNYCNNVIYDISCVFEVIN